MGNARYKDSIAEDTNKKDLIKFLEDARSILLDGIKNALKDNKINNIKKLYEMAGKISEELGDLESKRKYENRLKLLEKDTSELILENVNLTLKSIIQTINYEFTDKIKRILNIIENLLNNADEVKIAEKVFKRSHAQLNFLLIQYIRKMRILIRELKTIVPVEILLEIVDEWETKRKIIKLQIEKLKLESELQTKKYKNII
ncbi:MAG: hypothetical protein ACTSPY_00020 [Candidatus Helarchaeota archaeon]